MGFAGTLWVSWAECYSSTSIKWAVVKLVFVNRFFYPDISATSQMLTELARYEASNGNQVPIVTSRQLYESSGRPLPAFERIDGIQVHRVWTTGFKRSQSAGRLF